MRTGKTIILSAGVAFGFLGAMVTAGCQSAPASATGQRNGMLEEEQQQARDPIDQSGLTLALSSTKRSYVLGEPVYVSVELRNDGDQPFEIFPYLEPGEGVMSVDVTKPDGSRFRFLPMGEADSDADLISIEPGESHGTVFQVFFGGAGWTFGEPGRYTLHAIYQKHGGSSRAVIMAEPIEISIGTDEIEVGRYLLSGDEDVLLETGKFLVWQAGDHLRKGQARLLNLVDRAPDSIVATYAEFAMGKSLSDNFSDYSVNRVRPADCDAAERHFDNVDLVILPDNLKIQLHLARARCALRSRRPDDARERLTEAQAISRDRPEYWFLAGQYERLERAIGR